MIKPPQGRFSVYEAGEETPPQLQATTPPLTAPSQQLSSDQSALSSISFGNASDISAGKISVGSSFARMSDDGNKRWVGHEMRNVFVQCSSRK